ncbi:MAG: bacillithiol biosynthesis deacetylase BshB1 [Planctomycetes bacterium]|nr:bacillithiol biosynthesis deacetylase BshB1 [Planctomycetota bacterium]
MSAPALPEPADVLAFGPHPDDVEFCAGGLMLTLRKAGYRCAVVDLTRGEAGSRGTPETRAAETAEASRRLGLVGRENLGMPDGAVEATAAATEPVVAAIRRWRPRLVVAPCPVDLHPDHVEAATLVRRAYYLATVGKAKGGELPAHRPDALIHYFGHQETTPTFVVDVSAVWEERLEVMRCYASQLGLDGAKGPATNLTSPAFLARVEARYRYWGSRIGAEFGEPFLADRVVPLDDPVAALRKRDGMVR